MSRAPALFLGSNQACESRTTHMTDDVHFYTPEAGHGLRHDPFKAIVAPRVIGWISSHDTDGRVNLAPYSFFGAFATFPYIIGFSAKAIRTASEHRGDR